MGFTFFVGPELEYYYFKDDTEHRGARPRRRTSTRRRATSPSTCARRPCARSSDFGIQVEYSHHEVGPSQHEIDLRYDEALKMADNVMTYRLVVKEVAQLNGVYATFMPKPMYGEAGSGMHVHQSLFKGDSNAFYDADRRVPPLGRSRKSYIAGLLAPRARDLRGHQPVGQLLQAARLGLRGAGLHLLGAPQPLGARARADVQARQGEGDAHRAALARPRVQPVPRVLGDARRRSRRDRARARAARRRRPTTSTR